jgi:hypothetical protein
MTAAYLAKLHAERRRAVKYGSRSPEEALPLIIAGAGSGKNTQIDFAP